MAIHEMKSNNTQIGTVREPVIVMQRPQSTNTRQSHQSAGLGISASPPHFRWLAFNGLLGLDMKMPSMMISERGLRHGLPNPSLNVLAMPSICPQGHFKTSQISSSSSSSSSLGTPSSLGLFTGWGHGGSLPSPTPVDWSTGGMMRCDYTSIDWSLDTTLLKPSMDFEDLSDTWSTMFMGGGRVANGSNVYGGSGLAADPSAAAAARVSRVDLPFSAGSA
ncbi:hypothetical protein ACMD2_19841 [Ananas comosus]|uniref:Uncharacterized protein n=1 Tax=Ananas comosus TaxID=4615 RepID=A0A199UKA0_ANACO|nr:hypothetical protein ACMD2_19841 [Ananas comosus]